MEYLINGEIYLKKGPVLISKGTKTIENDTEDPFSFTNYIIEMVNRATGYEIILPEEILQDSTKAFNYIMQELNEMDDSIKALIDEITKDYIYCCERFISLGGNPEELNKDKMDKEKEDIYDYSGTDDFWQIFVSNDITMIRCNLIQIVRKYKSKTDMEEDFIRLSDFLERSVFVGREFRRTKPTKTASGQDDKSYMDGSTIKYIVLYATQDLFLIKWLGLNEDKYALVNSRYTLDGNYEFFGKVYEEYRDTRKVYSEIMEQIEKSRNKNR